MPTLDDCTRLELKALARFATPVQIAEAKARIARQAAERENGERLTLGAESAAACRSARDCFFRYGGDETYHRLFDSALRAARHSAYANRRWTRYEAAAQRLEREATRLRIAEHERALKDDAA